MFLSYLLEEQCFMYLPQNRKSSSTRTLTIQVEVYNFNVKVKHGCYD